VSTPAGADPTCPSRVGPRHRDEPPEPGGYEAALRAVLEDHRAALDTLLEVEDLVDVLDARSGVSSGTPPFSDGIGTDAEILELCALGALVDRARAARSRPVPTSLVEFLR
jgi:class 3 adenylate cyclase